MHVSPFIWYLNINVAQFTNYARVRKAASEVVRCSKTWIGLGPFYRFKLSSTRKNDLEKDFIRNNLILKYNNFEAVFLFLEVWRLTVCFRYAQGTLAWHREEIDCPFYEGRAARGIRMTMRLVNNFDRHIAAYLGDATPLLIVIAFVFAVITEILNSYWLRSVNLDDFPEWIE